MWNVSFRGLVTSVQMMQVNTDLHVTCCKLWLRILVKVILWLPGEKEIIVSTVSSSIYSFTLKLHHYSERFQLFIFSSCTPLKRLCTQHLAHLALCLRPTVLHCHLLGKQEVIIFSDSSQIRSAVISPQWFHALVPTNHAVPRQISYLSLVRLLFFLFFLVLYLENLPPF